MTENASRTDCWPRLALLSSACRQDLSLRLAALRPRRVRLVRATARSQVSLPELQQRLQPEEQSAEASQVRVRPDAEIQVSTLPLPLEEDLERSRSHSRASPRLRDLRDRSERELHLILERSCHRFISNTNFASTCRTCALIKRYNFCDKSFKFSFEHAPFFSLCTI